MKKIISLILLALAITYNSLANNALIKSQNNIEWPDFPVINIVTIDSVMPSYDIIYPPEGASGVGITNNNHVPGRMVITLKGDTIYDSGTYIKGESGMRIKVRGNTTGAYLAQHPYKIKLSKKADLLNRDKKKYKHKDWALLSMYTWHPQMKNSETNTTTLFGLELARAIGMPWEPETEFVNVVLNGQYQGLYYLIETIDKGEARINISDTGFVIENDPYWWNEDGKYFRTNHQLSNLGYTYKYPDPDDVNDSIKNELQEYMNLIEEHIWNRQDTKEYIDETSFATWILAHDILNTSDIIGSNMYFWKEDMLLDNINSTKLMMGPLWDFDSSYRNDENSWTGYHQESNSYFPQLFLQDEFYEKYKELYAENRPTILKHMTDYCNQIEEKYGKAFEESMKLHKTIYPGEGANTLHEQLTELLEKLDSRLKALDVLIANPTGIVNIQSTENKQFKRTDILGRDFSNTKKETLPPGIYIEHLSNGCIKKYYKQ